MASAWPSIAVTLGAVATSRARIPGSGSTAVTAAPVGTSSRETLPEPAARSSTGVPGSMEKISASRAIAPGK